MVSTRKGALFSLLQVHPLGMSAALWFAEVFPSAKEIPAGMSSPQHIRKGQRAWTAIKATAEEQRTLWLEVGVALMYGKQKEHRAEGQKFSEWVQEMFPGLGGRDASDAIWYATNSDATTEIPVGISHPQNIRQWCRDHYVTQSLPEDLRAIAPQPAATLDADSARRVAKTFHRADSKDEGADIARRQLEGLARKHGLDLEKLIEAAQNGNPDEFFRFAPPLQRSIDQWRAGVQADVEQMTASGVSIEAARHQPGKGEVRAAHLMRTVLFCKRDGVQAIATSNRSATHKETITNDSNLPTQPSPQ